MTGDLTRTLSRAMENDEFVSAMERAAQRFLEYRARLPVIPYAYTRTRLIDAPDYEVVVMHWAPGSISPIHDHGRSRCWVLLMEGSLEVENFERESAPEANPVALREAGRLTLRPGDLDHRLGPSELHRVCNPSREPTYSLQLYATPIADYRVIDEHSRHSRVVSAICDLELPLGSL